MNENIVHINLSVYQQNLSLIRSTLPQTVGVCAVVKADAYGHGLHRIAPAAKQAGAAYLGITENREAKIIRDLDIQLPILCLRPALYEEAVEAIPLKVEEIVGSLASAKLLSDAAVEQDATTPVHLKIDTGISRMGFHLPLQYDALKESISLPNLKVKGVMTHFPCADDDVAITQKQEQHFFDCVQSLPIETDELLIHTSNSAGTLNLPQNAKQLVRIGIASYGLLPTAGMTLPEGMQPVMSWMTRVVQVRDIPAGSTVGYGMTFTAVRDSRIATLPLGYANGYLRVLSNNADVLVHGKRCPVVGRVSMNMITVEVTDLEDVKIGDEVVMVGNQREERITIDELAERAGTISYELACLIGSCNRRVVYNNLPPINLSQ